MLEQLRAWLPDDRISRLQSRLEMFSDLPTLTPESLQSVGLLARFDEKRLELHIQVPAEFRRTNDVLLSGRGAPPKIAGALSPNDFSGYLNVLAGDEINFNHVDGNNGRTPFHSQLADVFNYRSWVLESNATYTAQQTTPLARGDVRLVKDLPDYMIRMAAGDLSYPVSTYQQFRPMAGLTMASNFSLQPYRVTIPSSTNEIFLKTPSKVVVFINGVRSQVLFLPAGRQDLRNLALGNGVNFVRLEITDDVGRVEIVSFPWVSEADLLASHLHQFSYSVGFPSVQLGANGYLRQYNTGLTTYSFFHRYGVSDHMTVGANIQGDHNQTIGGFELLLSSLLGTFDLEPVASRFAGLPNGGATRLRYLYTDYYGPSHSQRNLTLGVEYKSAHFAQLGDINPYVVPAYDLTLTYSQSVFGDVAVRLSGEYDFNRDTGPGLVNGYSTGVSLVKSWTAGFQTTLTASRRLTQNEVLGNDVFLLLNYVVPETSNYLSASQDTQSQTTRVDWRYSSPQLVGGYNSTLSYQKSPGQGQADGTINYFGNRGTIGASHDITTPLGGGDSQQTTALTGGAALAFAGNRFGVGRPISDSFALVAAAGPLSGQTVDINPNASKYYEARSDWLGPAVVPTVLSYQYYHLHLDPTELDPGLDLGEENYTLDPTYQSGTLIRVGTESTIMLGGTLVDPAGRPVGLESGEARLREAQSKPIVLFTNRKGKFRMDGFHAGTYELRLFDEKWGPLPINIPDSAKGFFDIGILRLSPIK